MLCFGPSLFSSIALILSIFGNSRCNLVHPTILSDSIFSLFPRTPVSIGLWCFETSNGNLYDARDISFDDKFDAARALGVTTLCLGWIIVIFYLIAGCKRFPPNAFRFIGLLGICACIFQGLVFLVYKSYVCYGGCTLDTGGKCAISATVMWFLTGVTSFGAGEADDDDTNDNNRATSGDNGNAKSGDVEDN
jgi:hypothetical protein